MSLPIDVVIVSGVRNQANTRPGEMSTEVGSEPEGLNLLGPPAQPQSRVVEVVQLWIAMDDASHDFVEIRIAAVHNSVPQVILGMGAVTTDDASVACNVRAITDGAILQSNQPLDHFED